MKDFQFPLKHPEQREAFLNLTAGDYIQINGILYTARDQAHKCLVRLIADQQPLPVDFQNNGIYYCGPTPPREDELFGSAGPTTSARMDPFVEPLMKQGLICSIGKGARSKQFRDACQKWKHLYLTTFGGAGAYLAKCITHQEIVAFPEFGPEAIYRLTVEQFPVVVAYDTKGGSVFE